MTTLSESAQRVQEFLNSRGVELQVMELPGSTRTALDAATAVGCSVEQIVKSLVFMGERSEEPVLVLASGPNRVDTNLVGCAIGEPIVQAKGKWVKARTGFAIGGVPPVGHTTPLQTIMDEDLLLHDEIWAAAGTPHALFRLAPHTLVDIANANVMRVKEPE